MLILARINNTNSTLIINSNYLGVDFGVILLMGSNFSVSFGASNDTSLLTGTGSISTFSLGGKKDQYYCIQQFQLVFKYMANAINFPDIKLEETEYFVVSQY